MPAIPEKPLAARLRRRKRQLLARLQVPPDGLPGSLALTHRRCGKPSCHCYKEQGHPVWSLTFMVQGKKHVERIPEDWVDSVLPPRGARPEVQRRSRRNLRCQRSTFGAGTEPLPSDRQ